MAKLFDADGKEVEAFTAEELEAKKNEALEAYKAANPDKSDALAKLEADLKAANDKIAAGEGDEGQKRRLKQEKEDAEKALADGLASLKKEFDEYKGSVVGGAKESILAKLTGGDKDLRAKIELKANNLTGYPDTPEGVAAKLQDAYVLATGNKPTPSMMDGMTGAGGRGEGAGKDGDKGGMTENGKVMANALGIKEDTVKKYSDADIAKAQGKTVTN